MKKNKRRFSGTVVLVGAVVLMCSASLAETRLRQGFGGQAYYVSLKGDDAKDGKTEKTAFRTFKKGVSVLKAGDTLIVKPGDYGDDRAELLASGKKDAPITIKAEKPGTAVLTGTGEKKSDGLVMKNKSHVVVDGLKFVNFECGLSIEYESTYTVVKRCIFVNNTSRGLLLFGNIKSPTDCHHHLFTENQFLDYATSGEASPTHRYGISDYGMMLYFATDVKATNNYFYGHHHQSLSFKKIMSNCVAANNVFEGSYYTAIYLGQNEDSEKQGILRSHNLTAKGNTFRPNPEYRLKSAIRVANVTGAVVRNNFIDAANGYGGNGIGVYKSAKDVKIYGNVIIDTAASRDNPAIRIHADCEIYNNTIAGCHSALEFCKDARIVCRNNLFYKNTLPVKVRGNAKYSDSVFEHNCWFPRWDGMGKTDISVDPKFVGPLKPLGYNPYNPGSGGKKDRSGRPTPKGDIKLTPFVPKFIPDFKRAFAYRLGKTSPCIDKGVKTGLPFVGKAPDIGAFEFEAKSSKSPLPVSPHVKCSKCGQEWVIERKEIGQFLKEAPGRPGRLMGVDCPRCLAKGTVHIMIKCPKCGKYYLPIRVTKPGEYATGKAKDVCPHCGTDYVQWHIDRHRRK